MFPPPSSGALLFFGWGNQQIVVSIQVAHTVYFLPICCIGNSPIIPSTWLSPQEHRCSDPTGCLPRVRVNYSLFIPCGSHLSDSLRFQVLTTTRCIPGWSSPNPNEFRPSTCHETWEDATVRLQDTRTRTWNWPHRSPLDAVLSDNRNVCYQPISRAVINVSDPVLQAFLTHGRRQNEYAWVWDGPYVQLELFYLLP